MRETVPSAAPAAARLRPYVSRLALDWLAHEPDRTHKSVDGALAFVDISGFTPLSERLAVRGKAGAEEIGQIITDAFAAQLDAAQSCGGELLKWGGDAVLLLFREPYAARHACRAAWLMSKTAARVGKMRTSAGRIQLGVSAAVHAGPVDLYLVGGDYRELIVAGHSVTAVTKLEHVADAGEVVVGASAAAMLEPRALGAAKGDGVLLRGAVRAPFVSLASELDEARAATSASHVDARALLSPDLRRHLGAGAETSEHRYASIAFVEFTGVDELRESGGADAVADALDALIRRAQRAARRHGVTFHYTDVVPGGGKILMTGGLPAVRGDDEERLLRAAVDSVTRYRGPLTVRAGLNSGRFFAHDVGTAERRVYSFSGDAVNLAARVMSHAPHGQVLATDTFLAHVRAQVRAQPVPPFPVKGKQDPVNASVVARVGSRSTDISYSAGPFVGRAGELDLLLRAARSAADGAGQVVDIVAEPGLGKSRLVTEAAARWSLETRRSVAETFGDVAPYLPFRHLVRALLDVEPDADAATVARALHDTVAARAPGLLEWIPLLGALLDVPTPTTPAVDRLDRQYRRERLEESTIALLEALVTAPIALIFEDVHAADDPSKALLARLATAARTRPWLLVTTRRPEGELALPTDAPWVSEIRLGALSSDEAASLLSATGDEAVTLLPHERRLIMERAGGSPLFLQELFESFRSTRSTDALPDRLDSLLAMQVDRLAPNDRTVLRAAAVIGVWFDVDTLADVLDRPEGIDPALWRRLRPFVADERRGQKVFRHSLLRDAAYEGLSYRRRRVLHERAAESIERRAKGTDEHAGLLSLHYMHAERYEDTWKHAVIAGDHASELYANAEAATYYRRAIASAKRADEPRVADVARVWESLGDATERTGAYDDAGKAYAQARHLAGASTDRSRLLRKSGVVHERTARYRAALSCYTRGRELVLTNGAGPTEAIERCEHAIAYAGVRYRQGKHEDCLRWAEIAVEEATRIEYQPGLAHALYLQDIAMSCLGRPSQTIAERSLAIYEELGDLIGQGNALNNMGVEAYFRGRWSESLDLYERSAMVRDQAGDVTGAATEQNNIAEILSDQGHLGRARELFGAAREVWIAAGYQVGVALATSNLGRLAGRAGDFDLGTRLLTDARARFESIGSLVHQLEADGRLIELLLLDGHVDDAYDQAERLVRAVEAGGGADAVETTAYRLFGIARARRGELYTGLAHVERSTQRAEQQDEAFELALSLAANATLLQRAGETEMRAAIESSCRRAGEIFESLGVIDVPVTSMNDRWPARGREILVELG